MHDKCQVCGNVIVTEAFGNSPGDHDPAYHVAQAYHYPVVRGIDSFHRCASCGERWPCKTIEEYSVR